MNDSLLAFEILGTAAFAISGASVAIGKKMDILGVMILGMTTAVGGGIIRDIILGVIPPMAFQQPFYALLSLAVSLIMFIPGLRKLPDTRPGSVGLLIADTVGLAAFTVIGVRAGMQLENGFLAVFVGVLTGVGGGVLRDLFAGDKPYIFVKHFYACASIIGAVVSVLLWRFGTGLAMTAGAAVIAVLRFLAAHYRWNLPHA